MKLDIFFVKYNLIKIIIKLTFTAYFGYLQNIIKYSYKQTLLNNACNNLYLKEVNFIYFNKTKKNCEIMKRYEKHIFVCENKRPDGHPRGCCIDRGSIGLKEAFKTRLKELGLGSTVRTNSAGCLDACEFGPSVVVYPEQVWYGPVTPYDVEEIIQSHIINNIPVERLKIKDKKYNQDQND